MKATKLPSGSYRVRVSRIDFDGKRVWISFTAPTEARAIKAAAEWKEKAHRDRGRTFATASRIFNAEKAAYLSPSTHRSYESIRRVICSSFPRFADKNIATIMPQDLQHIIDELNKVQPPRHNLQKEARKLSPKSIKNYLQYINLVLDGRIDLNALSFPKGIQTINVPTDEEIKAILKACEGSEVYLSVLLACFGPLRRGEIAALTQKDFDGNIVHVTKDVVRNAQGEWVTKNMPKTVAGERRVALPASVMDEIKRNGIPQLNPDQIARKFKHALQRAGLPQYRFHALRHWCASTLHAQGVPDAYIMARGGWETDTTLKKVYRHTLQDHSAVFSERALSHFENVTRDTQKR